MPALFHVTSHTPTTSQLQAYRLVSRCTVSNKCCYFYSHIYTTNLILNQFPPLTLIFYMLVLKLMTKHGKRSLKRSFQHHNSVTTTCWVFVFACLTACWCGRKQVEKKSGCVKGDGKYINMRSQLDLYFSETVVTIFEEPDIQRLLIFRVRNLVFTSHCLALFNESILVWDPV
jgi:hypothetical protein